MLRRAWLRMSACLRQDYSSKLPAVRDCNHVFYDAATRRLYASGGGGKISVFQQKDKNQYVQIAGVPTRFSTNQLLASVSTLRELEIRFCDLDVNHAGVLCAQGLGESGLG